MADNEWLQQLYDAYAPMLYRLAARKLRQFQGHTLDAEDILQEVFLLALKRDIRSHPCPVGWLIRATELLCRNWIRRMQRKTAQQQQLIHFPSPTYMAAEQDPSSNAALDTLDTLESKLPSDEWELLKAYSSADITPATLAGQQGISVPALRVRIHRLRCRLRAYRQESKQQKGE